MAREMRRKTRTGLNNNVLEMQLGRACSDFDARRAFKSKKMPLSASSMAKSKRKKTVKKPFFQSMQSNEELLEPLVLILRKVMTDIRKHDKKVKPASIYVNSNSMILD